MGCSNLKPTACGNGRKPYLTRVGCGNTIHFNGLDNETINQGIGIDLLDGVTAYDSDGDEIPFTVSPEELDKCDVGRHTVTYTATGKGTTTIPYLCGKNELEAPSCGNVTRSQDRTIVITQADDPVISGADYIEIEPNTDFNPLSGVTAVDDNGNTLVPTYSGTYYGVADGEIASFNTDISAPMKSLQVTLNPIQDLHGYDKPWVGGAGKNLLPYPYSITSGTISGITYNVLDDGAISLNGTATATAYINLFPIGTPFMLKAGTYTVSGLTGYSVVCVIGNTNNKAVGNTSNRQTFTLTEDTNLFVFIQIANGTTVDTIVRIQLEQGSSATSWTPYTNICPISGWDEVETVVSGVNVWDEEWELGGHDTNGNKVAGSSRIRSKNKIPCVPNTTYYFASAVYTSWVQINFYDANGDFVSLISPNVNTTFTTPSDSHYMTFNTSDGYGATYNNDISINYPSTDTDYHPYDGHTYTTDLPQTVYGGTLDVVSGVLTVDRAIVDLGTLTWNYDGTRQSFTALLSTAKPPSSVSVAANLLCEIYMADSSYNTEHSVNDGAISLSTAKYLRVKDTRYTDATAFKTAVSGQTLVYELATPTTIQCDPQTVQTLIGTNNVWGGNGDTKVVYLDNIPQGTFQYAENGLYEITYTAEDECGNSTTVVRQIQVGAITYRTVIYEDGTLIINESSNDIDANIEAHGSPTHIYEPLNEDGTNYVWTSEPTALWHESSAVYRIKQVEIGSEIYPTSTAFWFYDLRYCTHIDLDGIHTDNVTSMRYMFGYVGYFAEMTDVIDVSMFNTENVTDMSSMFNHCMVTSIDVSGFDTSKVTNMNRMFGYCANLERICSSGRFVIYNVTDGSNTFYDDTNLVGGNGTAYSYNYIDVSYARLDDPPNEPGYFTDCSA